MRHDAAFIAWFAPREWEATRAKHDAHWWQLSAGAQHVWVATCREFFAHLATAEDEYARGHHQGGGLT